MKEKESKINALKKKYWYEWEKGKRRKWMGESNKRKMYERKQR